MSASGTPRWLLVLATALVPVVLLLVLEGGLRLVGFGESWPLFEPSSEVPGYLQANPHVAKRFNPDPTRPELTRADVIYFPERKPEGALRLVVQGGSSAAGFPYGRFAGLAGMLGRRVSAALPEREVEVVTTAMSAVNSYTLLDFVDEIIAVEPDAVLVYAGHNEYLGLLGVGSAISWGPSRAFTLAFLDLRDLRIFQALQRLIGAGRRGLGLGAEVPTTKNVETGTLMGEVAREKEIPFGSALYERGLAQFRANLADLLAAYRSAGVPVYVGTVASNLRDQAPFASRLAPSTDAAAWRESYARALAALERGDLAEADAALARCLELDPGAADAHFALGRLREARGDYDGAREAYRRARDLDQLRFRAPEAMNAIIREQCAEYGAVLVEVEDTLAAASPHGLIGGGVMLEHVHPNPRGYFLISEAFFDALRATGVVPEAGSDRETAWRRNPLTEPDRFAGETRLAYLEAFWPFHAEPVEPQLPEPQDRIQELGRSMYDKRSMAGGLSWTQAMQSALAIYDEEGNTAEAARVAIDLADAFPLAASSHAIAGQLLFRLGRSAEAIAYLERAAELSPQDPDTLLAFASVLALSGERERAREVVDAVLRFAPTHRGAIDLRARLFD